MLDVEESLNRMAKASSMRWYDRALRREDENVVVKVWRLHPKKIDRNKREKNN